jgi:CRISPR system Cascade subunit CasD
MSVLLLRLAGPMQSWGVQSRFSIRDTGLEPSKSGVIGLLCAASGRPRQESVADLAGLRMGVRVDREGSMARDYHTAQKVARADGSGVQDTVLSQRYYLADADFLVGLEGPLELLSEFDQALAAAVWPLYLGRKAFVPGEPVRLPNGSGLLPDVNLETALKSFPWRQRQPKEEKPNPIRVVLECSSAEGEPRLDVPISFAERRFRLRHVKTELWPTATLSTPEEASSCT